MARNLIFNDVLIPVSEPVIPAGHRGLHYGDGCFETMRLEEGKIRLADLHLERLLSSMDRLGFPAKKSFNAEALADRIITLAEKNDDLRHCRARLAVYRRDLSNEDYDFVIETFPLDDSVGKFNAKGLELCICTEVRKSQDDFSSIKSSSYLGYVMAAKFAEVRKAADAIVLNSSGRVAETSIANLFVVTDGIIKTPALPEGCVAGVMRRYIIESCRKEGILVQETSITTDVLSNASEVFLTNAIRGIRWVEKVETSGYSQQVSGLLYEKFILQPG